MKKIITLILCGLFLLPLLAACGGKSAGPSDAGNDGPYGRYAQPLRVTTAKYAYHSPDLPDGMTMTDNPYFDILREKLNVDLYVEWLAEQYTQQLTLSILTGDVTDLIIITDYSLYKQLVLNDLIQPLTGLMDTYANDYMKDVYASHGEGIFGHVTADGEVMAIPGVSAGYRANMLWVRKDWLDILNLQPPKTLEEIIYVAQQFMQRDPGGNGPGRTIGIASHREYSIWGPEHQSNFSLDPICNLFGAYPMSWMADADGAAYYGSVRPEMKKALIEIKSMYDIGVLDASTFEMGWEEIWADVTAGRCGMWFSVPTFANNNPVYPANNPEAELICYQAPLDQNGRFTYVDTSPVRHWYGVRKGFSNPEALFKILNVCFDAFQGRDEESYQRILPIIERGSMWTSAIPTGDFNFAYYDGIPVMGERTKRFIEVGILEDGLTPATVENMRRAAAWADGSSKATGAWMSYITNYIASPQTKTGAENILKPVFNFTTETMFEKWEAMQLLERGMYRQILTGEVSIDYFDEFVTQWYEMGGRAITDEVNQYLREISAK